MIGAWSVIGDLFSTPEGSLGVAIAALAVVLGLQFSRPSSPGGWVVFVAYAGAISATLLAERRILPGAVLEARPLLRAVGAALTIVGLVIAGAPVRARRRASREVPAPAAGAHVVRQVALGLALVVLGSLARAPSLAGGVAVAIAVAALAARAALAPRPRGA